MSDVLRVAEELGAKGIRALALVDWDRAGTTIYETHARWLRKIFHVELRKYAVTEHQLRAVGLPVHEDHQLDGVIGRDPQRFRRELRQAIGMVT